MGSSPSSSVPGSTGTERFELAEHVGVEVVVGTEVDEHVGVEVVVGIEVTGEPMSSAKTTFLEVLARALVAVVANEGCVGGGVKPPLGIAANYALFVVMATRRWQRAPAGARRSKGRPTGVTKLDKAFQIGIQPCGLCSVHARELALVSGNAPKARITKCSADLVELPNRGWLTSVRSAEIFWVLQQDKHLAVVVTADLVACIALMAKWMNLFP